MGGVCVCVCALPIITLIKINKMDDKIQQMIIKNEDRLKSPSIIVGNEGCSHNTWEVSMLTITHIQI